MSYIKLLYNIYIHIYVYNKYLTYSEMDLKMKFVFCH